MKLINYARYHEFDAGNLTLSTTLPLASPTKIYIIVFDFGCNIESQFSLYMMVAYRKRGREKLLVSQKIYISENWNGKCEHRLVEPAIARFHHATHIVSNVALVSYNKFPDQHPFMKMGFSVYEKKKENTT